MIYQAVNILLAKIQGLMLRSDFYNCSDAYIVIKGKTTVKGDNNAKKGIKTNF